MITYSDKISLRDVEAVHRLLKDTYWASERTCADIEKSMDSSIVIAAFHDGDLVGFGRAVTDKVFFSWICDVVVDPEHRGRGIAKQLVTKLLTHPHVKPTRKVLVTRDAQELYHRFGFVTHPSECMIAYP